MSALLLEVLQKTISQNPADQKNALDTLQQASVQNFPTFVRELSIILRTAQCEGYVRQASGLQLKNVLYSKEDATKNAYLERWLSLPNDVRAHVKEQVVCTLGTEPFRPSIAAQCVAAIACAEIPKGLWPDVISSLMTSVTNPSSTEQLKESSLETLGYICQDIDPSVLEQQANSILTAIVHGMKKEEPSTHVRLAATNALLNSLEFTRNNFENKPERDIIMQVVCEATQCPDEKVKVAALQCLVRIMSLYYQFMEAYMGAALFPITITAMKTPVPDVALQGIEFWTNVCEEEIALQQECEEAQDAGQVPELVSRHYAKGAVSHVTPILLDTMANQDEADDEDDWTPSKASGVCVMMMAQTAGDDVVQPVLPFLSNFSNPDWKYREAAIMAFGSILDGPDPAKLEPLAHQAMPALINSLGDKNVTVRDTTAWTIGRVCDTCGNVVTNPQYLQGLLPAMSQALHHEPRVANNVCWAIVSLAKAAYEQATQQGTDATGQPDTFVLSGCFDGMVQELIKTSDRPDGHQNNLRLAAFETLMELIKNSPKDCYPVVQQTTLIMLKKLETLLNMEAAATSASDKSQLADLQALLCATLQSVLRKMRSEDAPMVGEHIMNGLLQIMTRSHGKQAGNVMEEALLALSTLVEVLGAGFTRYLEILRPHLMRGLSSHEEAAVCNAAVGVVTDLCRALETNIAPLLDEIVQKLIEAIQNARLSRDVKVVILGSFGDIALAIGENFERYITPVLALLNEASNAAVVTNAEDYDQVDYVDKLRENCIMAYTGILQGMKGTTGDKAAEDRAKASVGRFVKQMCGMINKCCEATPVAASDSLVGAVAGLIGDLVEMYGKAVLPEMNQDLVGTLLTRGRRSRIGKTKSTCNWATKALRKAI